MKDQYSVLFLCTGNSARSIMAEAILEQKGGGRFKAYSAGSHPAGRVHPGALKHLGTANLPTAALRSKSWEEFEEPGAPELDFIFTVCDEAAKEVCPVWAGHPITAHWGIADPAAERSSPEASDEAFRRAFLLLDQKISQFVNLPFSQLDEGRLKRQLKNIGQSHRIEDRASAEIRNP